MTASPKWFRLDAPLLHPERDLPVLEQYGEGWNTADVAMILDCFADGIRYRDMGTGRWLVGKARLKRYLEVVFARFPTQRWEDIEVFPHRTDGVISVGYRFAMRGAREEMVGEGYERIVLAGGKIELDDVYLRVDAMNVNLPLVGRSVNLLEVWSAPRRFKRALTRRRV